MDYEDRIVFFIDILGFKSIINNTIDKYNDSKFDEVKNIHDLLILARKIVDVDNVDEFSKSKKITQFSDSIVISFEVDEKDELAFTLLDILHLIINFVNHGILIRGGVVYGKLIHTEELLFGPGLIDAYETESKAALYPRVILDSSVIGLAKSFSTREDLSEIIGEIITKDTDDMYYIDYIAKAESELDDPPNELPKHLGKLKEIIHSLRKYSASDIKVKAGWLANKYNLMVEAAQAGKSIEELKKQGLDYLADYYSKLKKL